MDNYELDNYIEQAVMPVKKSTWRETTLNLPAGIVLRHVFFDTKPNFVMIKNMTESTVFVSTIPNISTVVFETEINNRDTGILHRPNGYEVIYLLSSRATTIQILSEERDFDVSVLNMTKRLVIERKSENYEIIAPGSVLTVSQNLPLIINCERFIEFTSIINITAMTGVTPTFTFNVITLNPTMTWFTTAVLNTTGLTALTRNNTLGSIIGFRCIIAGDTPSITVGITASLKS